MTVGAPRDQCVPGARASVGLGHRLLMAFLWLVLLRAVVWGQPRTVDELMEAVRAWEQVYTQGYFIKWWKYSVNFSPRGEVLHEDWVDYEVWLDAPRARCERWVAVRDRGKPVRRLHVTYVAGGEQDRWLSEPVGKERWRSALANVARPGYFKGPLQFGTPQGVLFQDSLVEALLDYAEVGCKIRVVGVEEHQGIRSLVVGIVQGESPYKGDGASDILYIALDRNYVCWSWVAQWWVYDPENEQWCFPCIRSQVEEWVEYEPGIWFPTRWRRVELHAPDVAGRVYRSGELIGRVVSIRRLEAGVPAKLLRLRFPPGTVVHELNGAGDVVRSYEVPEPVVVPAPASRWALPMGLAALGAALVLVLWYALRRSRGYDRGGGG